MAIFHSYVNLPEVSNWHQTLLPGQLSKPVKPAKLPRSSLAKFFSLMESHDRFLWLGLWSIVLVAHGWWGFPLIAISNESFLNGLMDSKLILHWLFKTDYWCPGGDSYYVICKYDYLHAWTHEDESPIKPRSNFHWHDLILMCNLSKSYHVALNTLYSS